MSRAVYLVLIILSVAFVVSALEEVGEPKPVEVEVPPGPDTNDLEGDATSYWGYSRPWRYGGGWRSGWGGGWRNGWGGWGGGWGGRGWGKGWGGGWWG